MTGMGPRISYRSLVAATLVVFVLLLPAAPASASCIEPPPLEEGYAQAEVVFVGRVVQVTNNDRTAVVAVEEVWKGPDLPATVTVHGGPNDPNVVTSVDRTFRPGTYAFFPISWSSDLTQFEDNACTLTQTVSPALDVIAPGSAIPGSGGGTAATTVVAGEPDRTDTTGFVGPATSAGPGASSVPAASSQPGDPQGGDLVPVIAGAAGLLTAVGLVLWARRDRTPPG